MVVTKAHRAITLVVGDFSCVRTVDWKVQVVGSKTVAVCVRVREETTLRGRENNHKNKLYRFATCFAKMIIDSSK